MAISSMVGAASTFLVTESLSLAVSYSRACSSFRITPVRGSRQCALDAAGCGHGLLEVGVAACRLPDSSGGWWEPSDVTGVKTVPLPTGMWTRAWAGVYRVAGRTGGR